MQQQGHKRKADWGGGGKGSKKKYLNNPASSNKGAIPLQSRGILVSCVNSKEQQAAREATTLFTEFYEELGGRWKPAGASGSHAAAGGADSAPTDIAAALASEVAELKDTTRQPFFYHMLGIHSVVFLECKDSEGPSPSQLVQAACQRTADTQQASTRFCNRFYPIEYTCFASMEKITELAKTVIEQHFPEGAEQAIEFAVQYDARAAPKLERMEVINAFAQLVPKPHKVNLGSPQKTILVNIVKATCGVAVVEQYKELCRYNIHLLAMPEEQRQQVKQQGQQQGGAPAPAAASAAAVPEQQQGGVAQVEGKEGKEQQQQQQQQQEGQEAAEGAAPAEGEQQQQAEADAE